MSDTTPSPGQEELFSDDSSAYSLTVIVNGPVPDFRLFWIFLWGEAHSTDSDGDSDNPASRSWTWLHMSSREIAGQGFHIKQTAETPLTFSVGAENERQAYRAAFFLARETKGYIKNEVGELAAPESVINKLGDDFDLTEALARADESRFRRATFDHPYP
jgi:hypothetical protein